MKPLSVLHANYAWLSQTETWMYTTVKFLPREVTSHIVCERTACLEQFNLPNIHARNQIHPWRYAFEERVQRWLGWKRCRAFRDRHAESFLVRQAKRHGAQLLHSHFGTVGWANLNAARRAGVKHITTFYGVDVSMYPRQYPALKKQYRDLFEAADLFLCEGPHMARCVVDLGCPKEKVRVHHLGVRVDEIPFKPRTWRPGTPLRILIAASFREKKGIPYALQALGILSREIPIEITLIGDASPEARSQAEKQKILGVIDAYSLDPITRILGYQPHTVLFDTAYTHHIFLSPSVIAADGDTEGGLPVALIEMAATGMPVVSTTHCDIPEVIQDGVSGCLAAERDVDGLVAHLRWLVTHPDAWEAMVSAARRHIEVEFHAKVQGERLAAIYQEVVGTT